MEGVVVVVVLHPKVLTSLLCTKDTTYIVADVHSGT